MNVKKQMFVGCLLSLLISLSAEADLHTLAGDLFGTWQYVDFDASMNVDNFLPCVDATFETVGIDGYEMYDYFKDLYGRNNLTQMQPSEQPRIPKIIHFIWVGGPLPDVLKYYINSWIERHPDWQFKLWTDEEVGKVRLFNQDLYDSVRNPGMRADILRYEVIYRYGGLYVDTDMECLQPVDILHHTYDFYACLHPLDTGCVQIGNAMLAARPGHPIVKHCIETLPESYKTGQGVPEKTGPIPLTRSVYALVGKTDSLDIVLPATYFFPLGSLERIAYRSKWRAWGAFGNHWWAKTWMDPEFRPTKFEGIENYDLVKNWDE